MVESRCGSGDSSWRPALDRPRRATSWGGVSRVERNGHGEELGVSASCSLRLHVKPETVNKEADFRARDPFFWLEQAKQLDRAAMLIWAAIRQDLTRISTSAVGTVLNTDDVPHANLGGVFWLNAGLALENLLKGSIIKSDPNLVENGRIARPIKTHDLCKLARHACLDLSEIDAFYLWVGTQCVTWAGRYPCSITLGERKPPVFSGSDVVGYKSLFERLASRFDPKDSRRVILKRLV